MASISAYRTHVCNCDRLEIAMASVTSRVLGGNVGHGLPHRRAGRDRCADPGIIMAVEAAAAPHLLGAAASRPWSRLDLIEIYVSKSPMLRV